MTKKEKGIWNKKLVKQTNETKELELDIEQIKANKIFENAFEWRFEFPEVLNDDGDFVGFDIVIGNPPYIFGRDWKALGLPEGMKSFFKDKYRLASYQIDLYILFLERSFAITNNTANMSFIIPNSWLNNTYAGVVRNYLLENTSEFILSTTPANTFEGVGVDTVIVQYNKLLKHCDHFIIKSVSYHEGVVLLQTMERVKFIDGSTPISVNMNTLTLQVISKMNTTGKRLGEICLVTRGIHPYRIGGYGRSAFTDGEQTDRDVNERPYHSKEYIDGYRPFVYGKDLKRFSKPTIREYVNYGDWIAEPRNPIFFEGERVYSRKILGDRLMVTYVNDDSVADQQVYITKPIYEGLDASYLTGVLGSKLMGFYIRNFYDELEALFPQIKVSQLKELPIPVHSPQLQKIVSDKVREILCIKKLDPSAITIELENDIDKLVGELFGLTSEEMLTIEGI